MNTKDVTRFEVIDHTPCETCNGTGIYHTTPDSAAGESISFSRECHDCSGLGSPGRSVYFHNPDLQLDVELQDEGRTLKVFIHERYDESISS